MQQNVQDMAWHIQKRVNVFFIYFKSLLLILIKVIYVQSNNLLLIFYYYLNIFLKLNMYLICNVRFKQSCMRSPWLTSLHFPIKLVIWDNAKAFLLWLPFNCLNLLTRSKKLSSTFLQLAKKTQNLFNLNLIDYI